MSPVWNPIAINYSTGVEIYEPETGKIYTEEEAKAASPEIRRRLCIRGKKIGCWVMTTEEATEALRLRNSKE